MPDQDRFDAIAREYDLWKRIDPAYEPLHYYFGRQVLKELLRCQSKAALKVFEIGYGTGYTTKLLLECDPRVTVVGTDPSSKMRESADRLLEKAGLSPRAHLILGDVLEVLPYQSQFQLIGSVCTMHNIAPYQRPSVCRAAYDRLEPGGLFISGDKIVVDDPATYLKMWDRWIMALEGFKENGLNDSYNYWRAHELDDHLNRITESETIKMLQQAGFERVELIERIGMYAVVVGYKPL